MPGGLTLLASANAGIPTPPTGKITIFFSTDINSPAYKDDAGVVAPLGSVGPTGSIGPAGPPILFIEDNIQGEDGIPGPIGLTGPAGSGGSGSSITFVHKLSDEPILSDTYQNDDELFLTVGANEIWQFEILLFVTGSTNSLDIKVQFTAPAAAEVYWAGHGHSPSSTTVDGIKRHIAKTLAAGFTLGVIQTATEALTPVKLEGIYIGGGTAGVLQLQWAQSIPDGTNPTIVKANSYLKAIKIS